MRWLSKSPRRRLWAIAVLGIGGTMVTLSFSQPIVGDLIESVILLVGALLALLGLLGYGPLCVKPDPVVSEVDQLVHLAELWRTGDISQEELEAAKKANQGALIPPVDEGAADHRQTGAPWGGVIRCDAPSPAPGP